MFFFLTIHQFPEIFINVLGLIRFFSSIFCEFLRRTRNMLNY